MRTSESISKLSLALLNVQREMGVVTKGAENPYYNSKYADINSFLDVALPLLNANGVVLLQPTSVQNNENYVTTLLVHAESGEFMEDTMKLVLSKQDMQALGSAITYARRYMVQSFLGMKAQDDDGEAAMERPARIQTSRQAAATTAARPTATSADTAKVTPAPAAPVVKPAAVSTPSTTAQVKRPSFKARTAAKPVAAPSEDTSEGLG